ncbi:hypothetical protein FN846DRAFT_996123 [Sphaerosporella brunnea]|uniref:HNH nuclease domain-containing protein n=1 Tax=Sphaerosporella brunnea TaxID=1250544 RepID=A0A5J5EKP7_9PEZI|nr:hypothetical protein FN846DRAFT_996123 [Sphaerosporella brunnea]
MSQPTSPPAPPPPRPLGSVYLPTPLVYHDALLGHAMRVITTTNGLDYARVQVITGVLLHCRCRDTVSRIARLTVGDLRTLADVLFEGLTLARNRGGGRRRAGAQSPPNHADVDSDDQDALHSLAEALELTHVIAPVDADADKDEDNEYLTPAEAQQKMSRRRAVHRQACLDRQLERCAISLTHSDLNVEAGHILPHALAAKTSYHNCAFWFTLAVVLGAEWQRRIWDMAGGRKSWLATNGIAMCGVLHALFDNGLFVLLPLPLGEHDQDGGQFLDVQLHWKTNLEETAAVGTLFPKLLDQQVLATVRVKAEDDDDEDLDESKTVYTPRRAVLRSIDDGDRFRLFTNDAKLHPLPYPALLELHAMLWALIGATGLSDTIKQKTIKRKRSDDAGGKRLRRGGRPPGRVDDNHGGGSAFTNTPGSGGGAAAPKSENTNNDSKDDHTTAKTTQQAASSPEKETEHHLPSPSGSPPRSPKPCDSLSTCHNPAPLGLKFSPWLLSQVLERCRRASERKHSQKAEEEASYTEYDSDSDCDTDTDSDTDTDTDPDGGTFGQFHGWRARIEKSLEQSGWMRRAWKHNGEQPRGKCAFE